MEQSPSREAGSYSQKILLLLNPKIYYHVHNSLLLDPVLSQMNPVHILTLLSSIHLNVILLTMPTSYKQSLPCRLFYRFLINTMRWMFYAYAHLIKRVVSST
jgi:hypothetical protein